MFNRIVHCILIVVICAAEILGQANVPDGWHRAGSRLQDYEMTVDRDIKHSGTASARIRFIGQNPEASAHSCKRSKLTPIGESASECQRGCVQMVPTLLNCGCD